ncbi:sterol desaturase family protein [Moritella viscosa]|uniref:Sterol desaturase n=1 Tax=Moritella viscosa TaxID=80854 RepID=A0A1L0B2T3_9GAMM|nr:sterol desaturase family protein [Moritella viscosa]SGY86933.1 Sterol desaturase [Moritella viscosa]SGY90670.1 Sterol desaturase [Moritella viscosa]SGY91119.1 Sterol desaturase [Moritella viscosa]SHO01275.1 Sterol desaturase [Moritella viscosa]SHO01527.1 Sterol desaturase [Moritella viscosa]
MNDWFIVNGNALRLTAFIGLFILLSIWEHYQPRRPLTVSKIQRWGNNIAIVMLNNLVLKLLMPFLAIDAAMLAERQLWGLTYFTNLNGSIGTFIIIIFAIILLDAAIYFQHRLFHRVPALWRLHRMHHSDLDIDVTTAIRFHPIEIILSMLIKIAVIITLGVPVIAVVLFELLLNLTAMFNHSNIRLPAKIDRYMRNILVTPDMHRVHHSVNGHETNHNFGFCLPWWDHLFDSYQAQPKLGHQQMQIGLPYFRGPKECQVQRMLTQPFRNK